VPDSFADILEQMPEDDKCYFWCLGMLHELESHGFTECDGGDTLSPKGIAIFDQLKATGWVPQEDKALAALVELTGSADAAELVWRVIEKLMQQ